MTKRAARWIATACLATAVVAAAAPAGADVAPPVGQHAVGYAFVVENVADFPDYVFVTLRSPRPVSPFLELAVVDKGGTSGALYAIKRSDITPPLRLTTATADAPQFLDAWDGGTPNASDVTKLVEGDPRFRKVSVVLEDANLGWLSDDKPLWAIVDHVRITKCCEPGSIETQPTKVVYTVDRGGTTREVAWGSDGHRPAPPTGAAQPAGTNGATGGATGLSGTATPPRAGCGCSMGAPEAVGGIVAALGAAALVFGRRQRKP